MKSTGISMIVMATCVATAAAAAAGAGAGAAKAKARGGKEATAVPATELDWVEMPNGGGVRTARLWGDMATGHHAVMVTFPAATVHPLHSHSADVKMVVVSGTFRYGPAGGPEKSYGAGSYVMVPGGTKHTSGCAAGAACVLFHEASGRFDMKPAGHE